VAGIVRDLKGFGVPVGVSISPFPGVNQILKDAGADEVKYNLECVDPDLFLQVCPGISYQEIMDALQEAVAIFGKNRVFTNIIVGLGESDDLLRRSIDELTEMGVIPVLRAVFPHPLRAGETWMERPSAERLLELAHYLKAALEELDDPDNRAAGLLALRDVAEAYPRQHSSLAQGVEVILLAASHVLVVGVLHRKNHRRVESFSESRFYVVESRFENPHRESATGPDGVRQIVHGDDALLDHVHHCA
jgi:hypothetical protein